ncbi:major facilitator superfamily domain-containing protein [Stachybotrys elegans]|uniref:Major facilitator superfamily domain-containing protein n=1 Tax=Stachybotrys elegans TaxID=80388 RepID=A0A8K0SWB4_9HYPO|nr:major facilitator superfamily domain-containing protein [Stachybotrys elegans]
MHVSVRRLLDDPDSLAYHPQLTSLLPEMTGQAPDSLPWTLRWRSSDAFVIASVTIAIFTDTFLYGLLIPVFPTVLENRCSIPEEKVQAFTSLAVGLSGAGNLIGACLFGYLADHIRSRRTSLLLGLATFIGATVMIWVVHHVALMCVGRFLQGFASAAVWSVGLALLADTVGKDEVPVAMGYVNIGFSCGTVIGPIVGGMMYSLAGFDGVMAFAVGLLIFDVVLRLLLVEKKDLPAILANIDDDGSESAQAARTPLLRDQPRDNETDSCGESQASEETEVAYRTLISSARLLINLVCAFVQAVTMSSLEVTLPIHLKEVAGYEPFSTALVFIPLMLPAFLSPLIGWMCNKVGNRPVASSGYVICGVFMILLRLHQGDDTLETIGIFTGLALIGIAMCMIMTPVLSDIFDAVEELENEKPGRFGEYGAFAQAYGLFEFSYAGGVLLGPILAGWLKTEYGWSGLTLIAGIVNFATIALMLGSKV